MDYMRRSNRLAYAFLMEMEAMLPLIKNPEHYAAQQKLIKDLKSFLIVCDPAEEFIEDGTTAIRPPVDSNIHHSEHSETVPFGKPPKTIPEGILHTKKDRRK